MQGGHDGIGGGVTNEVKLLTTSGIYLINLRTQPRSTREFFENWKVNEARSNIFTGSFGMPEAISWNKKGRVPLREGTNILRVNKVDVASAEARVVTFNELPLEIIRGTLKARLRKAPDFIFTLEREQSADKV